MMIDINKRPTCCAHPQIRAEEATWIIYELDWRRGDYPDWDEVDRGDRAEGTQTLFICMNCEATDEAIWAKKPRKMRTYKFNKRKEQEC